ncbi:MAG: S-methyl-5'-thioinosine phosphorylase, partial [Candidatus Bathyarchaeia archaeon]
DVVGMTNSPEVFLAREMEICYGALCYVSNKAAGMQNKLTASEVIRAGEMARGRLRRVVENAVALLPPERSCPCSTAKREARV